LPGWADELKIREILWTKYGVPWRDMEIIDILRAAKFAGAEAEREKAKSNGR